MANIFSRMWESLKITGMSKEDFLKKAQEVHGDKYDYSKVRYSDADTRVTIICPKHGKFLITPREHVKGIGCEKCIEDEEAVQKYIESMNESSSAEDSIFSDEMLSDIFATDVDEEPEEVKENTEDSEYSDEALDDRYAAKIDREYSALFTKSMLDDIFGTDLDEKNVSKDSFGVSFKENNTLLYKCPDDFTGDYEIPAGVTKIEDEAFQFCEDLKSIKIPDTVIEIGKGAFSGCIGLKKVVIPNSVRVIGYNAFADCKNLTDVALGNKVYIIAQNAFECCYKLQNVTIPNGVGRIGYSAFFNCSRLSQIKFPKSIKSVGPHAFETLANLPLKEIIVPKGERERFSMMQGLAKYGDIIVERC